MFLILALTISASVFAKGQDKIFVFESNLPAEIEDLYNQEKIKSIYSIRTDLNPFYLRGDFDGDKIQDYALGIVERKTEKKGMLIYHAGTKTHYIIGAGKPLSNGKGRDNYNWMDAWKVYVDKEVEMGVGETKKITLKGEAILTIKLESSSGIVYWTGKEYRWYQQGD
ncbi:hypothetical protein [Chryseolinea sp. H1M3-3]|uniref:hypothetical protein n=1 Tax=Chryseolinea sp. H1M3-3 TaxID=3034144 RepID=UPI0023ECCE2A|nr:hypothetical protein [Chryseolinea sp. H1M3-3]